MHCKVIMNYVDYSNEATANISGFSYFPATQELLYGKIADKNQLSKRKYQIVKLNLKTGTEISLGEGILPAWSPDGSQIAYIGLDGLYVMQADGKNTRRLVQTPFFEPWAAGSPEKMVPQPRWSPDGAWLVYHHCIDSDNICMDKDSLIYKLRVSNGKEEKVIIGECFPVGKQSEPQMPH